MRNRTLFPMAAIVAILSGCASPGPDAYRMPPLSIPQAWQYADGQATPPRDAAQTTRWWANFKDPALEKLVDEALQRNADLALAAIAVRRAQLQAGLTARNALPSVNASLGSNSSRNLSGEPMPTRSYSTSISAGYEVDLWGRLSTQRAAAEWSAQASEEDRNSAALALIGTTMNLYWKLAYLNQRLALSAQSIAHAQKALDIARVRYQAGAAALLDVIQAEQALAAQRADATQLEHQRTEARNAMALLFDVPPGKTFPELSTLPDGPYPVIDAGLPATLLARRPDVRAAELHLREAIANVASSNASYYPAFSLTGSLGTSSVALLDILRNPVAALGTGITLPFIQWREMQMNRQISDTDRERAVIAFRQTFYRALSDVENALSLRRQQAAQADYLDKALASAYKAERIAEVQYRAGSVPIKTWLDAQESRRSAEAAVAANRLDRLGGYVALYQALGGDASATGRDPA